MRQKSNGRTQARKRVSPLILVLVLLLLLVVIGLVVLRLHGWSGQRVEGTLTALVNPWNGVDTAGYRPTLVTVENVQVDQSCAQPLENMLGACRAAGNAPALTAGYLSREQLTNGAAAQEQAEFGFSEHEIGLAVDFADGNGSDAASSAVASWLKENAWQYGFILRYPEGSEESTGMAPNPWHYRYVGEAAAAQIQQLGITLEEYVNLFYNDSAAVVFER